MRIFLLFLVAGIFISCNDTAMVKESNFSWPDNVKPPSAEKIPHKMALHGDTRIDNYYWMNAYFLKSADSTRVLDYLKAENAYVDTMMRGLKDLRETLFAEMKGRIKEKDESVPQFDNGYYYYNRFEEGKEYFAYCRRKGSMDAPEEVLLDVNEMAKGHPYYSATGFSISPDAKLLAFGVDTVSRREYTIYIKNLETGEIYSDALFPSTGSAVWGNDGKTIFWTRKNPKTLLSEKIMRHTLGKNAADDETVYTETDNTNYIWISKTRSDKYILISSQATLSAEIRYLEADKPTGAFKVFQPRMKDVLYSVDHQGDRFLVRTNHEAKNFRLMECPLDSTSVNSWKELIPHRTDALLEGVEPFKDHLVVIERKDGLQQFRVRNIKSGQEHYLDFGEPSYSVYVSGNPEYDQPTVRYNYTSLKTPASVYDYNMNDRSKDLRKQQEVVGGYNPDDYVTERIYAKATDGAMIGISLVYKKGFNKNGEAPLLLNGYGSYGYSNDPYFMSNILSLLDRGFVFGIAHIRGGEEMGRQWYEDGKLMKKMNTFTDFINCGEYLVQQRYTSKEHLYAIGGSAGGLLMGAVVNMRPDLWNGVIAAVPFVDVVTTMLDESIPLTTNEYDEWGNPNNSDAYFYMKSYSPYDNVKAQEYPHMLVTTGLHDSQVQYFEPAKWVAKLREVKTGDNVLLFHTNMEFGHGGASGRFDYLKDIALEYAFLLGLEGVTE